jgi:LPPG:FO 2-phospho-L-lactate transferase
VDTVLYALANRVEERRGWGPRGDTYRCMDALAQLGADTWFSLGDADLAMHLRRTELLAGGFTPTAVTAELAARLGIVGARILPMTDSPVETWVQLAEDGQPWVHFQEYFVKRRTDVPISAIDVRGLDRAAPAPGVLEALERADLIVLAPSNPFVSLGPILATPGMREQIRRSRDRGARVAAVSPLIGGATVKGPAARMLRELGFEPSATGVAAQYSDILDLFLIDPLDAGLRGAIEAMGPSVLVRDALMRGRRGEARLARALLAATLGRPGAAS